MMTWRGKAKARQRAQRFRLDRVEITCRFEVYDDVTPAVVLERHTMVYDWPLEHLRGLNQPQLFAVECCADT